MQDYIEELLDWQDHVEEFEDDEVFDDGFEL